MKILLLVTLTLIFLSNCLIHAISQADNEIVLKRNTVPNSKNIKTADINNANEISNEFKEQEGIPFAFKGIDFKNFSYPTIWRTQIIPLKNGIYEYEDPKTLGHNTYNFEGVTYAKLIGDGKKEAVVQLFRVICGGSCDGGSHLFYFYSVHQNKLKLVWQIETGSLAYGCGLKSFTIKKRTITLELFRKCHFKDAAFENDLDQKEVSKFEAKNFTRFTFNYTGQKFALEKRDIFPYTEESVKNYRPEIRISND